MKVLKIQHILSCLVLQCVLDIPTPLKENGMRREKASEKGKVTKGFQRMRVPSAASLQMYP